MSRKGIEEVRRVGMGEWGKDPISRFLAKASVR